MAKNTQVNAFEDSRFLEKTRLFAYVEKRKRHSSPVKSRIAVRLERLRSRRIDLWADDDNEPSTPSNVITLSDSEEEKPARKRKSRRKTPKNATCLICSILSQLSTKNCCADHLSRLKHPQWLPEQVMILPVTDQIVQRYLDPQQIHQLRTQTSTNSVNETIQLFDEDVISF